jgi:hypothetical protein
MKLVRFLGLAVILAGISFAAFATDSLGDDKDIESVQKVKVTKNLASVFVSHEDPKSPIIKIAKKGDILELRVAGDSWYKVKVDGKTGYLQARDGKIVSGGGSPVMYVFFVLVLLCGAVAVILYIMKQRSGTVAAARDIDDDDLDDLDDD